MPLAEENLSRCDQCGALLESHAAAGSAYGCLNCLLLGGPDEELRMGRAATKEEAMLTAEAELLDTLTGDACG